MSPWEYDDPEEPLWLTVLFLLGVLVVWYPLEAAVWLWKRKGVLWP